MIRGVGASAAKPGDVIEIREARCVLSAENCVHANIKILGRKIQRFAIGHRALSFAEAKPASIDLTGFLVMPGLINAHDHLEFALYPRLADAPYRNYIEWGEDIHAKYADTIARQKKVPLDVRLWWGGIRNLLCGVTTVCHHNPLWPELTRSDFPVRVVRDYGWAHSVAFGGDLLAARAATPKGQAFIIHACEGIDDLARGEIWELDALGLLDEDTVLVHGLAIDDKGAALLNHRRASLIACPSSNSYLYDRVPNVSLLCGVGRVALGSDSPLTAEGDLLDEVRFAMGSCGIPAQFAFDMVTKFPAALLRLENGEGRIREAGNADLIAIRDTGGDLADRLGGLSMEDVEFVMIGGRVQLASETILDRLPFKIRQGLEPLSIGGTTRWLRALVTDLVRIAEEALGGRCVKLGSREVTLPLPAEAEHAC
jgi:cytosine/adenosine deaminase-related metal-dependent hydrolase